jgi:hypothetical protein
MLFLYGMCKHWESEASMGHNSTVSLFSVFFRTSHVLQISWSSTEILSENLKVSIKMKKKKKDSDSLYSKHDLSLHPTTVRVAILS